MIAAANGLAAPAINVDAIPQELKDRPQWVFWREELRKRKPTKVPFTTSGKSAKSDDPSTWSQFAGLWTIFQVLKCRYSGIGYVFSPEDPYCGVDLDLCMHPDGTLTDWAEQALQLIPSYTEVSPSGLGLKIIVRGRFPVGPDATGKSYKGFEPGTPAPGRQTEIAAWNDHRYFTMTGRVFRGLTTIVECQSGLGQLYALHEHRVAQAKPCRARRARSAAGDGQVDSRALEAMLHATKNIADGNDGSRRLVTVACRAIEFDLGDAAALATIRTYAAKRPFPTEWSDDEVLKRIRDAEKKTRRGSEIVIANYEVIEVEVEGSEPQKTEEPLSMDTIIDDIRRYADGWPRRVDNVLFVDDPRHGIDWFDRRTTAALFGWLRRGYTVRWKGGGKFVGQAELFAELERTAFRYDAIELLPHEPPISGIYYRGEPPPAGDGTHLQALLDRFRPATPIDRDLIQAAFMTPLWGGPRGCRPAFVITSDAGRGAGKTRLAELIARLFGGFIDVSAGEDIATLKQRFLSPEGQTKRIAFLDNVKTLRFSWAELESLITTPVISGKRLYVGEGQRPNVITWLITLNGMSLATDMAQRSVIIKLAKGKNDAMWLEETTQFVTEHRSALLGDLIAALRAESFSLSEHSRWAAWEKDVLACLPEPNEAQRVILERQGESNCELDEAELVEEQFREQLQRLGYAPDNERVRVPVAVAARWYGWALGDAVATPTASIRLNQMSREGQLRRVAPEPGRTHGRCFLWNGEAADVCNGRIANDLQERISAKSKDGKDG